MSRPLLHFAHANGFPARVYSAIFEHLAPDVEVIFKEQFAHDARFPVKDGWRELADELIDFLDRADRGPVIGAGHSMGASITFMAAVKRPDLFRGIVLLDPVLFNGWRSIPIRIVKRLGVIDRFSPAGLSKNRRNFWPDRQSAESYFRSRGLFASFHPQCLDDLIEYSLRPEGDGWTLAFSRERETAIFRTGPHHFDAYRGRLRDLPGVIVRATQTNIAFKPVVKRLARQHGFLVETIEGSHLFPLEQPEIAARLLKSHALRIWTCRQEPAHKP